MAPRAVPVSKLRARRRQRRVILAVSAAVLLLVVIAGAFGLTWLPGIRIHTVVVTGAVSVPSQEIEDTVRTNLVGTYGFIVPKNNALVYPAGMIARQVLEKFPAIASVTTKRTSLTSLTVAVVERTPIARWCGESLANPAPCYLLDASGVVYAPAADSLDSGYVTYYGPVSTTPMRQFVSTEQFRAVSALVAALQTNGSAGTPMRVDLEAGEVHIIFASGFTLMYSLSDDGADVLQRFVLALQAAPFTTHAVADFLYLDLRFGDKLYYQLK